MYLLKWLVKDKLHVTYENYVHDVRVSVCTCLLWVPTMMALCKPLSCGKLIQNWRGIVSLPSSCLLVKHNTIWTEGRYFDKFVYIFCH